MSGSGSAPRREYAAGPGGHLPPLRSDDYPASHDRAPAAPLVPVRLGRVETGRPVAPDGWPVGGEDMTARTGVAPLGERIVVAGHVLDEDGDPVAGALVEVWQANSAGRYTHETDRRDAPRDPNFDGIGRFLTGAAGEYRLVTVRPAPYPGRSGPNSWRPAHIHFSVVGDAPVSRLVTQMYFEGDPLLPLDPIFMAVPAHARARLVAPLDLDVTVPGEALGYRFDIVLRGHRGTPGVQP